MAQWLSSKCQHTSEWSITFPLRWGQALVPFQDGLFSVGKEEIPDSSQGLLSAGLDLCLSALRPALLWGALLISGSCL